MSLGVRGANPIWLLDDLTANLFDDTFYMYVLENNLPYIPATVYHYPDLTGPWTNPIQFLANGTLPIDIFFESEVTYRLEFRQNDGVLPPSQNDPLIYEVNDYVAGVGGTTPIDNVAFPTDNQITNPQFAIVNFNSPLTVTGTNPDPIEIAPGWFLELTGTGNAVINQVPLTSTTANTSNSPYALQLTMSGWSSVFLRQRFQQNGVLWANKFVSCAFTGAVGATTVSSGPLTGQLVDSNGVTLGTVIDIQTLNQTFNAFTGSTGNALPDSTNPDIPPAAYVDFKLEIPSNIDVYLTSFQVVAQDNEFQPAYQQDTVDRQIDHTFHYYKQPLEYKPLRSYLVGWDFPLNPAQFEGSTVAASAIGANKSKYVWDQTIIFQSANSGVRVTRGASGDLTLTAAAATQMAIVQYFDQQEARKILNAPICVNVSAKASANTVATVSLWYKTTATLPDIKTPNFNSIVATLDANGKPNSFNGTGWLEVPRKNNQQFTIRTNATTNFNDYALNGWDMQGIAACNTATYFAIVIGTATVPIAGTVRFNSVSLQAGTIPTRPAPQTFDEVLSECQYFYEKSYDNGVYAGNATASALLNQVVSPMGYSVAIGPTYGIMATAYGVRYNTLKRTIPLLSEYSNAGTIANVSVYKNFNGVISPAVNAVIATYWAGLHSGNKGYSRYSTFNNLYLNTGLGANSNYIAFNYVADARLGAV